MPAFALQFAIERVPEYAARYSYEDDRSTPRVALNSAGSVEVATPAALSEASSERERIAALAGLPAAYREELVERVIPALASRAADGEHLAGPERYPILDKRALHALGTRPTAAHSFRFWEADCLRLAERAGVDGRTLDQALWRWDADLFELTTLVVAIERHALQVTASNNPARGGGCHPARYRLTITRGSPSKFHDDPDILLVGTWWLVGAGSGGAARRIASRTGREATWLRKALGIAMRLKRSSGVSGARSRRSCRRSSPRRHRSRSVLDESAPRDLTHGALLLRFQARRQPWQRCAGRLAGASFRTSAGACR